MPTLATPQTWGGGRIFLVTLSGHLLDCERHSPSLQLPIGLLVPCLFQTAAIHTERKPLQGDTHRSQGPSGTPGGGAGRAQGLAHSTPARLQPLP